MNGVLASFGGSLAAGGADEGNSGKTGTKVNAHPIVGWKGFEDVVAIIPGKTVDVAQHAADGAIAAAPSCTCSIPPHLSGLMGLRNLSSQQYYRRRRALPLSFSFWVAVPTQKYPQSGGWENICVVRGSIVPSKENNRTRIRTKVRDCYDWYRERKFFNRCVDTRELHEGAATVLIERVLLLLSCKILDVGWSRFGCGNYKLPDNNHSLQTRTEALRSLRSIDSNPVYPEVPRLFGSRGLCVSMGWVFSRP